MWGVGQGVKREGFHFLLAMVKMCSTWPLLNKYALKKEKKNEVGLQTPPLPQTPYIAYGKGKNFKFILAMAKMYSN